MKYSQSLALCGAASLALASLTSAQAALVVTPTTDSAKLASSLGGQGLTINSVSVKAGAAEQFGTYTGFNQGAVTLGDGIVLSTGFAANVSGPARANEPDDDNVVGSTTEFDNYARSKVSGFNQANDVAALKVDFTLANPGAVKFDFAFGSTEYSSQQQFPDAFFTFLDGTSEQISFANGAPVYVGSDVGSLLTKADTNSAFGDPHSLIKPITTTTAVLSAGDHSLLFEIGDVEDWNFDSAVFISGLGLASSAGPGQPGPVTPIDPPTAPVPLPAALPLLAVALSGLIGFGRRRGNGE